MAIPPNHPFFEDVSRMRSEGFLFACYRGSEGVELRLQVSRGSNQPLAVPIRIAATSDALKLQTKFRMVGVCVGLRGARS